MLYEMRCECVYREYTLCDVNLRSRPDLRALYNMADLQDFDTCRFIPGTDMIATIAPRDESAWSDEALWKFALSNNAGVVIDLTNTAHQKRDNLQQSLSCSGIKYAQVLCARRGEVPSERSISVCKQLYASREGKKCIIFCRHGRNRTGFICCCILCDIYEVPVDDAIRTFTLHVPPGIRKQEYIQELKRIYTLAPNAFDGLCRQPSGTYTRVMDTVYASVFGQKAATEFPWQLPRQINSEDLDKGGTAVKYRSVLRMFATHKSDGIRAGLLYTGDDADGCMLFTRDSTAFVKTSPYKGLPKTRCILDCELVGSYAIVLDIFYVGDMTYLEMPYCRRVQKMYEMFDVVPSVPEVNSIYMKHVFTSIMACLDSPPPPFACDGMVMMDPLATLHIHPHTCAPAYTPVKFKQRPTVDCRLHVVVFSGATIAHLMALVSQSSGEYVQVTSAANAFVTSDEIWAAWLMENSGKIVECYVNRVRDGSGVTFELLKVRADKTYPNTIATIRSTIVGVNVSLFDIVRASRKMYSTHGDDKRVGWIDKHVEHLCEGRSLTQCITTTTQPAIYPHAQYTTAYVFSYPVLDGQTPKRKNNNAHHHRITPSTASTRRSTGHGYAHTKHAQSANASTAYTRTAPVNRSSSTAYDPELNAYNLASPEYIPGTPAYNPPSPEYIPGTPAYNPPSPEYDPGTPEYNPELPVRNPYNPLSPEYNPESPAFNT